MYRTIIDEKYSKSPECPFTVHKSSMDELRESLGKYKNEKTLCPPDAQLGVRKAIVAALGDWKHSIPEGEVCAVFPYSMDVGRVVDGLGGPSQPSKTPSADGLDSNSGTMSMDLDTEDGTQSTLLELLPSPKAVGLRACKEVTGAGRANGSPGRRL